MIIIEIISLLKAQLTSPNDILINFYLSPSPRRRSKRILHKAQIKLREINNIHKVREKRFQQEATLKLSLSL